MNLQVIELLAIFQLITSSDGNNIKLQAIKRLVKIGLYTRLTSRRFSS